MPVIHHLKITLKNIKPPVWREVLVPSDIRLDRLHQVIQIAMGWQDCHLHQFSNGLRGTGELIFGPPQNEFDGGMGPLLRNEKKATLLDLAPEKGDKFIYWYDFGDDWFHQVSVKGLGEPAPGTVTPLCIKAAGDCPPEDCGGPWGYDRLQQTLSDPSHEGHEEYVEMLEWVGGEWPPAEYDIAGVNRELAALSARWTRAPRKAKAK